MLQSPLLGIICVGTSSYWRRVHVGRHVVDLSRQSHLHRQTILTQHKGSFADHGALLNSESCCSMCCCKEMSLEKCVLFAAMRRHWCLQGLQCKDIVGQSWDCRPATLQLLLRSASTCLHQGVHAHAYRIVTVRFERVLVLWNEARLGLAQGCCSAQPVSADSM